MLNDGKGPLQAMRPAESLAECYMGIIHGARGILFFRNYHPAQPGVPKDLWDGPRKFSRVVRTRRVGQAAPAAFQGSGHRR